MANIIKIKRSATTATPATLEEGELAYSENSGNLFIGTNGGVDLKKIGGNTDVLKLNGIEAGAQVNTVDSVNGNTGTVVLTAGDVGAAPTVHTHLKADITDFVESDYATGAEGDLATTALQDITAEPIGDLSDVVLTTPANTDVLQYNGTDWVNVAVNTVGVTDHTNLTSIGTNTHAQIDTHLADGTVHFTQAAINITESQISDFGTYIPASEKAAVNGVATLNANGQVPDSQIPPLAITETYVVANELAQLALTVQEGDVAVRTDENKSYIALNATNATMADWQVLLTPTDAVLSVNGQTGIVVLSATDVGAEPAFTKNTAFNKNFGFGAGDVFEGNATVDGGTF